MKCPYCHEDFATWAGHDAHVSSCAYKDNPLPEPEEPRKVENDGLDSMKMNELKAMAEEMGIEGASRMKKAELIEAIREAQAEAQAAAEYYGGEESEDNE